MKYCTLLLFTLLLYSLESLAQFDLNLNAQVRSYSLAGGANMDLGLGLVFWGDKKSSPWYGYLRPSVRGTITDGYSAYRPMIEFFPISFLGVRAGFQEADLRMDHPDFDCVNFKCAQRSRKEFYGANFSMAAGPIFFNADYLREKLIPKIKDRDFISPVYALVFDLNGEEIDTSTGILGFKLSKTTSVFALGQYMKTVETNKRARFSTLNMGWTFGKVSVSLGAGVFDSELKDRQFSALLNFKWKMLPSVSLF